ncbi:MAG TPA: DUF6677 family protein [Bryobacteraceae bacterium]|jgi:hypothetical protein|nr:DUF6677 family protein [Bryobacteraceae bacterium]
MPANTSTAGNAVPARSPWLTVALAWLIPGSGHFLLGRRGRAIIFFVTVAVAFLIGVLMRGPLFQPSGSGEVLSRLIQYGGFIGNLACGLFYFLAVWLGYGPPDQAGHDPDYGSKFLVAAGLLNILGMVDAYEIATKQKD